MDNTGRSTSWERIQRGVKDTERLIGQKQYNMAMVKARQTLEYMVRCLGERACIVDGDLVDTIDELYKGKWISKSTCEHYHKIRTIGNKAVHEGNDNAYDANQAYHLLSQEAYVFADQYASRRTRGSSGGRSASASRTRSGSARRRRRKKGIGPQEVIRILIPVLLVVLLLIVIRLFTSGSDENDPGASTSPAATYTEPSTEPVTMESETVPETEPESAEAADVVYRTTDVLNVRADPSTNNDRIGQIPADTVVDYVSDYDENWAIITYEGQEAYVSKEFLTAE